MIQQSLTDAAYIQKLFAYANGTPKRSMGQNFLICPEVVEAATTVIAAGPKHVTELGAGIGTLTQSLEAAGLTLRAIEKDDNLIDLLHRHLTDTTQIVHGDMQEIAWEWDTPYQVVGNIPYNLTGLIIRRLTQLHPAPTQALFLVQEEVARRLVATPPNMSLIGLSVQLWGQAQYVLHVPRNCFWPQPKVTSALVALTANPIQIPEREDVIAFAKICFQAKRKQLGGTLKRLKKYSDEDIKQAFAAIDMPSTARPQELSSTQWLTLWHHLENTPAE